MRDKTHSYTFALHEHSNVKWGVWHVKWGVWHVKWGVWHDSHAWHDESTRATWLIHMRDMTHFLPLCCMSTAKCKGVCPWMLREVRLAPSFISISTLLVLPFCTAKWSACVCVCVCVSVSVRERLAPSFTNVFTLCVCVYLYKDAGYVCIHIYI